MYRNEIFTFHHQAQNPSMLYYATELLFHVSDCMNVDTCALHEIEGVLLQNKIDRSTGTQVRTEFQTMNSNRTTVLPSKPMV